jgi:oligopeptide transport system substrate-binding protein
VIRHFGHWLVALVPLAAAGCAEPSGRGAYFGKTAPPEGQELRYISGSEPESLDPQLATGQPEARILLALFDGLTEYDPETAQPIPSLASSWESNADNSEFTFHLRTDARWSNGAPVTADDVVYSWRRGLTPSLASRAAFMAYDILYAQAFNEGGVFVRLPTGAFVMNPASPTARLTLPGNADERTRALAYLEMTVPAGAEFLPVAAGDIGVEAVDRHAVKVRLSHAIPFFPKILSHQFFRPVFRQAVEAHGSRWIRPEHIVTSGSFLLERWAPYDAIVVRRNPDHWDAARTRLERITFFAVEDLTTMMNLFKAGEYSGSAQFRPVRPCK